jgi:hypothetical protein
LWLSPCLIPEGHKIPQHSKDSRATLLDEHDNSSTKENLNREPKSIDTIEY